MKIFTQIAVVLCAVMGLASTGFATECGGNQCPSQSFGIGGIAGFDGWGGGAFVGDAGQVDIVKNGGSKININLDAGGSLCGLDCADGSFTFEGGAFENVNVQTHTSGNKSGTPVEAVNSGHASGYIQMDVFKLNTP